MSTCFIFFFFLITKKKKKKKSDDQLQLLYLSLSSTCQLRANDKCGLEGEKSHTHRQIHLNYSQAYVKNYHYGFQNSLLLCHLKPSWILKNNLSYIITLLIIILVEIKTWTIGRGNITVRRCSSLCLSVSVSLVKER